jgi:hypothetical protein
VYGSQGHLSTVATEQSIATVSGKVGEFKNNNKNKKKKLFNVIVRSLFKPQMT